MGAYNILETSVRADVSPADRRARFLRSTHMKIALPAQYRRRAPQWRADRIVEEEPFARCLWWTGV